MNSDAWDNDTSSGKAGFYTNDAATLTYVYGTGEAQAETVDYVEKPVLQVNSLTIPVNKEWKNTAKSEQVPVKVELYQDGKLAPYKTLTLNADNQWRADFQHVAKHHQYQIKEQALDGFVNITEKVNDAEGYRVSFNGIHKKSVDGILNEDLRINVTNEKENIPLTNVVTFGTNMIPGILLATVALFVLAAISKLFYGKKDKKQDK